MNWKIRIDVYTLLALCTKQTTNENLLHSTGTLLRALCDLNGKEIQKIGNICICMDGLFTSAIQQKLTQHCKATILQ